MDADVNSWWSKGPRAGWEAGSGTIRLSTRQIARPPCSVPVTTVLYALLYLPDYPCTTMYYVGFFCSYGCKYISVHVRQATTVRIHVHAHVQMHVHGH